MCARAGAWRSADAVRPRLRVRSEHVALRRPRLRGPVPGGVLRPHRRRRVRPRAYDPDAYATLDGYAADVLEICRGLDLRDVIFVGHSVSAMIGALAAIAEPERFAKLVFVGPSPRYIDDGDYVGGFAEADIVELLDSLESNYLGWSSAMAPVIMGNPDRPELGEELTASFCRTDPEIARRFARVTFLSDNRADLARVTTPTLVLQCTNDVDRPGVGRRVRPRRAAQQHATCCSRRRATAPT